MTIDQFQRLVRILANSAWVRYYLHMFPNQMVLELALPAGAPAPTRLHQELIGLGFTALDCSQDFPSLKIYRWSVVRTESPGDADFRPATSANHTPAEASGAESTSRAAAASKQPAHGYTCFNCRAHSPSCATEAEARTRAAEEGWKFGHFDGQGHFACAACASMLFDSRSVSRSIL